MKFSLSDGIVTGVVGLLSILLLYFFFSDLNAVTGHGNEPALGTIFFKKQTATRKSSTSQVWERLRNQSPVYQSDTLRTDEDSEAVVNFEDGLSLDMLQNSMLKLTTRGQSTNLDFKAGSITLRGSDKSGAVTLGQDGHTVSLSSDAQLVVTKTKNTTSLELSQGTASVSDAQGNQQTITPTSALDLNDQSGTAVVRAVDLIPRAPEQGARLLSFGTGKQPVKFAYQVAPSVKKGASGLEIQLSNTPSFATVTSFPVGGTSAELPLEPGTWYWRVAAGEAHSSTRQLSLSQEEALTLVQPQNGTDVSYRKTLSPVRFSWTASEHVAFWDLELAKGGDFKTPAVRRRTTVSSLSLDGLQPGAWSWRVTPHYTGTMLSEGQPPQVGHFTITQRPQMTALNTTLPVEGTLVQIQELATKGLAFTWEPPAEAVRYELAAYKSPAPGSQAVARFDTLNPYRIVTPQELSGLAGVGKTYWTLRWFDEEGNASPVGSARTIQAVDGALALRLTFPPDGYRVADRFVTNTRFSWKSNLATRTVFQVSRTQDFKEVVSEIPVKAETALGSSWGIGTFYWRLTSYNANGSVFIQTAARRIEVVEPFASVHLAKPGPGSTFFIPEQQDYTLSWPVVKDADYYQLTLFAASESSGISSRSSFEASVEQVPQGETVQFKIPLSEFPEGPYVARIQAFAREKLMTTSVIGLHGDSPFSFKRLVFAKLVAPADGSRIDGLQARRHGIVLEWDTPNLPPNAVVKLMNAADGTEIKSIPVKSSAPLKMARLKAGDYTWTLEGSIEGYDVSAPKPSRFTLLEIPKLPPPDTLDPPDKTVFGPKELRKMKGIDFTWSPVALAHEYVFGLYEDRQDATSDSGKASSAPVLLVHSKDPKASLPKIGVLHRGTYYWEVQAYTLDSQGEVEQEGIPVRSHFAIDLPVLGQPKLPQGQAFYGR